jgi:altronate hydrolase
MDWNSSDALVLAPGDNIAVALRDVAAGTSVRLTDRRAVTARDDIPQGHKIALDPLPLGHRVIKSSLSIGITTAPVSAGAHVHAHNLGMDEAGREHEFGIDVVPLAVPPGPRPTFLGYERADGRVGTRNYIGIVTSVNCSATTAKLIAAHFTAQELRDYPQIDGVVAITHQGGCGLVSDSEGAQILMRTLRGYAEHPNFAAVLMLGLGCEMVQLDILAQSIDGVVIDRLNIQDSGGIRSTVAAGIERITAMLPTIDAIARTPHDVRHLTLALNCGGSDGFSGITANPALGVASDRLVAWGGTSILAETPEIYGAEHLLTRRAVDAGVGRRLLDRIDWWTTYVAQGGGTLDNNPSPGNKQGGLTTILEKSLGAVAKGGTAPLAGVLEYAERAVTPGLLFMDTPGYDPVSVTGLVAGGANIVCFTTGRGSVFGCKPVPSIKIATNSRLARSMPEDIDINAGTIVDGEQSIDEVGDAIFERILSVASGEKTVSEELGVGQEEFVPWHVGAVT